MASAKISCWPSECWHHLNNQKPERGISTGIMGSIQGCSLVKSQLEPRAAPGTQPGNPHFWLPLPLPSHFSPNKTILGLPLPSELTEVRPSPRALGSVLSPTLKAVPTPCARPPARSLMAKAVSGCPAVQPQEMVENSFSRASWLSVWKARFLRTFVLMDRTSSLKKAASLCCSE